MRDLILQLSKSSIYSTKPSFGIREDENWRLVFLIFITPRFFLPPGKSVMWLRLDAARHVTGWFETIF
ncbi:hypothetical protein QIG77_12765, partial [Klebsiella pneumoniae]|nr:hypothetical protein [Klebsiella pneumoniae]